MPRDGLRIVRRPTPIPPVFAELWGSRGCAHRGLAVLEAWRQGLVKEGVEQALVLVGDGFPRVDCPGAGLGALAYIPYTAVLTPAFEALPFFSISSFYWPLPVLIFSYAALLRRRAPELARNLAIGAGILCVSLTARSVDEPLCAAIPLGTHFLWHILNAVMLGWMIETWRRHVATS